MFRSDGAMTGLRQIARALLLVGALAALVGGLAACGGEDTESESGSSGESSSTASAGAPESGFSDGTLTIVADPDGALAYTTDTLEAEAGKVEVDFQNPASLGHNVVIETEDGEEVGASDIINADSDSFEVDLEPGTYTYYCSVPGHQAAGMEGTLTVE